MQDWQKDWKALEETTVAHQHRFVDPPPLNNAGATPSQAIFDEAQELLKDKAFVEEISVERTRLQPDPGKRLPTRRERRTYQRKIATAMRKAAKRNRALRDKLKLFSLDELKQVEAEVARLTHGG